MRTLGALLLAAVWVQAVKGTEPQSRPAYAVPADTGRELTVKLRPFPEIRLERAAPATRPAGDIRRLITSLSKIDQPYYGLSPTLSGWAFAPVPELTEAHVLILTNHGLVTPQALVELVKTGPAVLPYLLEALSDQTATGLKIDLPGLGGGMWFDRELDRNPLNATEQAASASVKRPSLEETTDIAARSYTVKVGDVCFVVLGQIVGRRYVAVRYQPSGCVVINSPTQDADIARYLRKVWASDDPEQYLWDSLMRDYNSEGVYNGETLDGWSEGSDLQVAAVTRLLYYFPKQSAGLVTERLRGLRVSDWGNSDLEGFIQREVANGVCTEDFIKAVAWCQEPVVRTELVNIIKRTDDAKLLVAAAAGMGPEHKPLVLERLGSAIDRLPDDEQGPYGDGYELLVALGQLGDEKAKPIFSRYLAKPTVQRGLTMSLVLRKTRGEWAKEFLPPLLDDRRDTRWAYTIRPGWNQPHLPIRVCDEAAETLNLLFPDLPFKLEGTHAELDEQIKQVKAKLRARKDQAS